LGYVIIHHPKRPAILTAQHAQDFHTETSSQREFTGNNFSCSRAVSMI
jgi:hypothetical protein